MCYSPLLSIRLLSEHRCCCWVLLWVTVSFVVMCTTVLMIWYLANSTPPLGDFENQSVTHAPSWTRTNAFLFLSCSSEMNSVASSLSSSVNNAFNSHLHLTQNRTTSQKCSSAGAGAGTFCTHRAPHRLCSAPIGSTNNDAIRICLTDQISTVSFNFA